MTSVNIFKTTVIIKSLAEDEGHDLPEAGTAVSDSAVAAEAADVLRFNRFYPKISRLHHVSHEFKGTHWLMSSSFSTLAKVATLFFSRYR